MATFEEIRKANETIQTMDVKGREYAMVHQRIKAFRMVYPMGYIKTDIVELKDGVVTMKATVGVGDMILGTGYAQEKETSSYINKTSFIENCVPLDTEILTKDGWKYYYQVKPGDDVLSINMEAERVEFCKLLFVNVHKNRPLVELESSRFRAVCTPQHKWLVRSQYKGLRKQKTEELKTSEKIVQNIRQSVDEGILGRKLGWLMCDCEITRTKNGMPGCAYINQSKHLDDITELFGEGVQTKKFNESWKDNYEWNIPAEDVRNILGHFRIKDYSDLPKATLHASIEDVAGCYKSMMLADGEARGFSSTYIDLVEAVQIMCARLGIATGKIKTRMMKNSTRPIHTLSIKKTDGAYVSELNIKNLPPHDVWCPTTENGTWFMRQGTFVTATSNCETSAWGRALGAAGFGIDTSVASYEEVANAIKNQADTIKQAPASKEQIAYIKAHCSHEELDRAIKRYGTLEAMPESDAQKKIMSINKNKIKEIEQ